MAPSESLKQQTKEEWRELGFYYDFDRSTQTWKLIGSRAGLLRFADLLRDYAQNPRRADISEHDHYGPYLYLKICTWSERQITEHAIAGTPADIAALADLVVRAVHGTDEGAMSNVGVAYCPSAVATVVLEVAADDFDPAKADTQCW